MGKEGDLKESPVGKPPLDEESDETLMRAYQQGDEKAFATLYRRHSPKVYGYLRARLRERALVDDVFQATFLKLHKSRGRFDPSYPFVPWLFTVCRSALVDGLRAKGRRLEELDPIAVENAPAAPGPPAPDLPDLGSLPAEQRRAVELRYLGELPFEEIARKLETSPANARQLVSRAVRRLRALGGKDA